MNQDVSSLSNFKRNAALFIQQMKKSGEPVVLTVSGQAQLVVQDAEAYQKVLESLDHAETVQALKEGLEDVDCGRTRPAREVLKDPRQSM